MEKKFFSRINIKRSNTFLPLGTGDAELEASKYEEMLHAIGRADIQILGVGENGHIAFNEPNSDFEGKTHVQNLTPSTIEANSRFFENQNEVPKKAITMGIGSILNAKKIIVIAYGEKKRKAI
jgi:glucosamine-6-phosphate deaminase